MQEFKEMRRYLNDNGTQRIYSRSCNSGNRSGRSSSSGIK